MIRKARDELSHVVGSEKTRIRKIHAQVKKQVSGAFPLCFTPNPETRVALFRTQVKPALQVLHGNALESPSQILLENCALFSQCRSAGDTRKKVKSDQFLDGGLPVVLRLKKKIQDPGHLKMNPANFVSRPKSDGKASIQIGDFFLNWKRRRFSFKMMPWSQFWLLMEKKWWFGKPATSSLTWWAPKKRGIGKLLAQEETGVSGAFSLCFRPNPETRVERRFRTTGQTRLQVLHWRNALRNLPARFSLQNCGFFLVSDSSRGRLEKKSKMINLWMEAFPWSSGLEKKIQDPGRFENKPPPMFVSRPKSDGKASSPDRHFFVSVEKGVVSSFKMMPWSQFWLLMEKKRWFGKPATSSLTWWAPKKRGFENTFTRRNRFSVPFPCVSRQTLKHGSTVSHSGQTRLQVLHGNALESPSQILLQNCGFFLVCRGH